MGLELDFRSCLALYRHRNQRLPRPGLRTVMALYILLGPYRLEPGRDQFLSCRHTLFPVTVSIPVVVSFPVTIYVLLIVSTLYLAPPIKPHLTTIKPNDPFMSATSAFNYSCPLQCLPIGLSSNESPSIEKTPNASEADMLYCFWSAYDD
jgi:hypothetical protein